ncbi:cytochrome P450 [Aestuariimicrobium sp. T2.26MG-19.2B]|uniref:cytochrome P450 n=1 Tax=Aestuariimicrobium sp. T2.26MG-19.2B TaxID=3040679 RepID=UPI00247779DE|nr:cytochrome P450 [Aestuariimicrobium sp. T2.26MG-19.2B]CAI9401956.1 hypothetical protein AESSP_00700 [Aestuariimicrobium sp. T2.26MG-19.2B]
MGDDAAAPGSARSRRRAVRRGETTEPRVAYEQGIWRIRSLMVARQVLRARHQTTQAGFTAEWIPKTWLRNHPILLSDGPVHDAQRSKVARFFAPTVIEQRYLESMERTADRMLAQVAWTAPFDLDLLALHFSVEVTGAVVGLTHSSTPAMARRLTTFFRQPPLDLSKPRLGRTGRQWAMAAVNGLLPILRFHVADVRPAIRERRAHPQDDIISHLIAEGYTDTDILVECVTYGTAGMVTTREFITMAAWHLLTDAELADRYRAADGEGRRTILAEILRLEPVVGHLYRRTTEPVDLVEGEQRWTIPAGKLVDVSVRQTNTDPRSFGADAMDLCPGRAMPTGVNATGLTFGDGAHRCPGQPLAIVEAEVLLSRLLELHPVVVSEPEIGWVDLIEGYVLRGLRVSLNRVEAASGRTPPPGGVE